MLYKYNMYKVLRFKGEIENSKICLAQANYIAHKYGIKFEFDMNPGHFVPLVDPDDENTAGDNDKNFKMGSLDELAPMNNDTIATTATDNNESKGKNEQNDNFNGFKIIE